MSDQAVTMQAVPGVPLLVIRTQTPLGESGRTIEMQGYIDRDVPQKELDELLDRMVKASNRQRAINILPSLYRNLDEMEYRLNENRKRLAEQKARLKVANELRDQKIAELTANIGKATDAAYAEHHSSGRRGAFDGEKLPAIRNTRAQIATLEEGRSKENAEIEVRIHELEREIREGESGERSLGQLQKVIAECEASAKGDGE